MFVAAALTALAVLPLRTAVPAEPIGPRAETPRSLPTSPRRVAAGDLVAADRTAPESALESLAPPAKVRSRPAPKSRARGRFEVVPGSGPALGTGPLHRFTVEIERGLPVRPRAVAAFVERVLVDRRGWRAKARASFRRVVAGRVRFRVVLARPATADRLCAPLRTSGIYSCFMRGRVVLNFRRWRYGAAAYAGNRLQYRIYLVNHEVGHALGYRHTSCAGRGRPAPVMVQQTKGVAPCTPNPWPRP